MAMVKQSMNLGELENIRRSEQLSPMDVEKLRFLLPQEWRQKTKQLTSKLDDAATSPTRFYSCGHESSVREPF